MRVLPDPYLLLPGPPAARSDQPGGGLLERLARALDEQGVAYCQWKGYWSTHRWSMGEGDVDLLVDQGAIAKFRTLAGELGFKSVVPPGERHMSGMESYLGIDPAVLRLLRLQVHYQLILGEYGKTTYRIPIERPLLESAVKGDLFKVPAPAYQFLVFVLRMILRQRGRPLHYARTKWLRAINPQLEYLEETSERGELARAISQHLPFINLSTFDRCVASLRGALDPISRTALLWQLHRRLRAHARRAPLAGRLSAVIEKRLPRRLVRFMFDGRMRPVGGGKVIALVGGRGSGESAWVSQLWVWLSDDFATMRADLGNPSWSLSTGVIEGALKLQQALDRMLGRHRVSSSTLELLRHLCTARDCYRLYERVRRFTARGGIAICERYPVPQNQHLVGPRIPPLLPGQTSALARHLGSEEVSYYQRMLPPDELIVLRMDPESAILPKPEGLADSLSSGSATTETDWSTTRAQVINASLPAPEVLKHLKSTVWSML